jgi:hypothetical protein
MYDLQYFTKQVINQLTHPKDSFTFSVQKVESLLYEQRIFSCICKYIKRIIHGRKEQEEKYPFHQKIE